MHSNSSEKVSKDFVHRDPFHRWDSVPKGNATFTCNLILGLFAFFAFFLVFLSTTSKGFSGSNTGMLDSSHYLMLSLHLIHL